MNIILNHSSMVPIYEQVMDQIKNEIIQNKLKEGEALPSVRTLSSDIKISALTVKKAYDKLEEEGFVKTVHGKGTFVLNPNLQIAKEARIKLVENDLVKVVDKARTVGMTKEELVEMIDIFWED